MEITELEEAVSDAAAARDASLGRAERSEFGVVHTPPALGRYTVRALDRVLRERGGSLARTEILDPACGPGQFLAAALAHLGPSARGVRLRGIDRDAKALARAERLLRGPVERAGAVLRLDRADTLSVRVEGSHPLSVIGNPPWAGRTATRGDEDALTPFKLDDEGLALEERRIGVLSDAYVRFMAWALREIRDRQGGLALVTNASFLDGVVHRGMRGALRRGLDAIEVVDLGGSALVARALDHGADANVFGVRPGVSVFVGARWDDGRSNETSEPAPVAYTRVRGDLGSKLDWLGNRSGESESTPLRSEPPDHLFVPAPARPFPDHWLALDAVFAFHAEGLQTNRDAVVIDADRDALLGRLQAFALGLRRPDLARAETPSGHYDPQSARRSVREALERDPEGASWIRRVAYRPFAPRFYAALKVLCHRPRRALARAIDASSAVLYTVRKDRGDKPWRHVSVGADMPDGCLLSSRSSCRTRAFPSRDAAGGANLTPLGVSLGVDPESLVHYAAAILGSPSYQTRFDAALKQGYPRVPPPGSGFLLLAEAGRRLREASSPGVAASLMGVVGHHEVRIPESYCAAVEAADGLVQSAIRECRED